MKFEFKDAIVDLSKLYSIGQKKDLPYRTENSDDYSLYRETYLELTKKVPNDPGWYIWYNSETQNVVYIGKSTNLKNRLRKSLKDGYHMFWLKSGKVEDIKKDMVKYYGAEYTKNIERASKIYGADRIFVISPVGVSDTFANVEIELIHKYKPEANSQKGQKKILNRFDAELFREVEEKVCQHFKGNSTADK